MVILGSFSPVLHKIIGCGYQLEAACCCALNMFLWRNKKNVFTSPMLDATGCYPQHMFLWRS